MSKSIKILLLLITAFGLSAAVAKLRRIPAPIIDASSSTRTSSGSQIILKGQGFIKDFSNAHKIILKKKGANKKIRLKTLSSTQEELKIQLPEDISYGDYNLYIYLKTRFFKSKKQKLTNLIKVRPKAPSKPKLNFLVVKNKNELIDIIDQDQEHELILNLENELKPGINSLTSFYYEDGYKSLSSEAIDLYFIEESNYKSQLAISSENPLESYAETNSTEKLNVTNVTHKRESGLTRTYHLITPSDDKYLATQIKLSPLYIKKAHIKSPEYIIIQNRDSKTFDLNNCHINDEITKRYQFEDFETIPAQSELKIEGTLSLNDTGDIITLICQDIVIDSLEYTKADAEGFATN
jgi:ribosomal protein S8